MQRILVIEDDEALLELIGSILTRAGYQASTAASPGEARKILESGVAVDLVVSDVNLPEMTGFAFRDEIRGRDLYADTSFLFVSGADEGIQSDIATSLRRDPLLLKPFAPEDLRRAVRAALRLGETRVLPMPDGLDAILQEALDGKWTGILAALRGPLVKRVVLREGAIVFAASNDRRDLIGQAFIRAGLISERDLVAAFERKTEGEARPGASALADALAAMRKVSPEQSRKVFEHKIREAVLDLFLWEEGVAEFVEGPVDASDAPSPVSFPLAPLIADGRERRARWREVLRVLPQFDVSFRRPASWPDGFPRNGGEAALAKLLDAGRTLAEILVEMHGQDYAIGVRVAGLVKNGTLEVAPPAGFRGAREITGEMAIASIFPDAGDAATGTAPVGATAAVDGGAAPAAAAAPVVAKDPVPPAHAPDAPAGAAEALEKGMAYQKLGDLPRAQESLLRCLEIDPRNVLARARLEEVQRAMESEARRDGLQNTREIVLAISINRLVGMKIPANEAFVLSRLAAGKSTVGALVGLCPFPEHEVLEIIQKYLDQKILR